MGYGVWCLKKQDFGSQTSFNHLRILHGGLRYLQSLDLRRFRDSVAERSWFLRHLPGLARPVDCLLPLYGNGLHRPAVAFAPLWPSMVCWRRIAIAACCPREV
ncbi:MAG: hypothetical protein R2864_09680 [Syntrophotaleaceae bacterium]